MATNAEVPAGSGNRLVLCFDGTSNKFTGNEADTNIVKIYEMLDRTGTDQYHYYQPGIGSYVQNQLSNTSSGNIFIQIKDYFVKSLDQAVGTSFVHHVIAGYQFLMRYYGAGDKIYIFGFSRGAYTARFLAEMIYNIGLLSHGNEEMVRFAWATFSDFQRNRGTDSSFKDFMLRFKETFCREKVTVHFLGLFDCVNSVSQYQIPLFRKSTPYIPTPPATHIRHAVSIHERRLMFKPALFLLDPNTQNKGDIKEVYFAGNHGDIGGGWHCDGANYLLSDIALKWMVDEVLALPDTENVLAWRETKVDHMQQHERQMESVIALKNIMTNSQKTKGNSLRKLVHDPLAFGRGLSWVSTLSWWILEVLPFGRYELMNGKWVAQHWPPNFGAKRDIPLEADIHPTVQLMRRAGILMESDMPMLGGEEPYDRLPKWNFFGFFWKPKQKEPHRDHPVAGPSEPSDEGGEGGTESNHTWTFDHMTESGAKTWQIV